MTGRTYANFKRNEDRMISIFDGMQKSSSVWARLKKAANEQPVKVMYALLSLKEAGEINLRDFEGLCRKVLA